MAYEVIFNDMIDSLTMAELQLYEYNINNEKSQRRTNWQNRSFFDIFLMTRMWFLWLAKELF